MKKMLRISILLVFLGSYLFAGTSYQSAKEFFGREMPNEPTSIKVLLATDMKELQLETHGRYRIYDPLKNIRIGYGFFGKKYSVLPLQEGIQWGETFPDIYQITLFSDSIPHLVSVNGTPYKGRITIYSINGTLSVVNEVSIEDYVSSILSSEFRDSLNPETIASLAIAERTSALFQKQQSNSSYWDVVASEVGYKGYSVTLSRPEIANVVKETKGMVLSLDGYPFMATWTGHSAGKTAPYSVVFRKDAGGPQQVVKLPYAELDKNNSVWSVPMTKSKLAAVMEFDEITNVALYKDKASDKVYGVRVFNKTLYKDIPFVTLRDILGKDQLKSSQFDISWMNDTLLFTGYGRGPGVGICLYSANTMVEKGLQANELLNTFFPGSSIVMIDDLNSPSSNITSIVVEDISVEDNLIIVEEAR